LAAASRLPSVRLLSRPAGQSGRLAAALTLTLAVVVVHGGASASAATIRVDGACPREDPECPLSITFEAAPGELNTVSVSGRSADGSYLVSDATAPLSAGANCVQVAVATARCPGPARPADDFTVHVRLGDGDDTVTAVGGVIGEGGPGADTLVGGPGADALLGGAGADTLRGGDGDDVLDGDGAATATDADLLDGGQGTDTVSYSLRELPVRADLSLGRGGSRGEGDRFLSVENLEGGLRANRLTGDDGANVLEVPSSERVLRGSELTGGAGDDQLRGGERSDAIDGGTGADHIDGGSGLRPDLLVGGAGADVIVGSPAADRIAGGAGDDSIEPVLARLLAKGSSRGDQIACGPGLDSVDFPYPKAFVRGSCERVAMLFARLSRPRLIGSRFVDVAATLVKAASQAPPCGVRVDLLNRRTGRLLGRSAALRWREGRRTRFRIALTAAGRRELRVAGSRPVLVRVSNQLECDRPQAITGGFAIRLR
jgi:hypothetical protein